MTKIIIIEDEQGLQTILKYNLENEGYQTVSVIDGKKALETIEEEDADLILLDWMLPHISGVEICKQIRQNHDIRHIPILMLTARGDEADKVSGLSIGADDYMTKPFAIEELLARIKVHLSRAATDEGKKTKSLEYGKLKLNLTSHTAHYGEDELSLTKKEYELLEYLLKNKDTALSRDNILNVVWGYEYFGDTNVVDVYVRYLRQKIDDKYGVKIIGTVRGIGYIIRSEE